ncbi:hypothetical protein [Massilia sp. Root351]|uniref:hypothetical protein n=1 Tax=Massilia sp. Root351 TaxID=1736522 RepID=UPI000ACFC71B
MTIAIQPTASVRELGIDPAVVQIDGSGMAIGHPLGATGARITGKAAARRPPNASAAAKASPPPSKPPNASNLSRIPPLRGQTPQQAACGSVRV